MVTDLGTVRTRGIDVQEKDAKKKIEKSGYKLFLVSNVISTKK